MRTDYLNELMNDVREHNKETRLYEDATTNRLNHLTKVRDKLNHEIERLGKLKVVLSQVAAENGAEDFRPSVVGADDKTDPSSAISRAMKNADNGLESELADSLESNLG